MAMIRSIVWILPISSPINLGMSYGSNWTIIPRSGKGLVQGIRSKRRFHQKAILSRLYESNHKSRGA